MENSGEQPLAEALRYDVIVAEDKMQAYLLLRHVPAERHVDYVVADVLDRLPGYGVVNGVDEAAIREAVEKALATGSPPDHVLIAQGQPVRESVDAALKFHFQLDGKDPAVVAREREAGIANEKALTKCLVRPGDILAVVTPPQPGADGLTVAGVVLRAVPPCRITVRIGAGVQTLEDGLTYVAAPDATGYADFLDGALVVEDPFAISADHMEVRATFHPPTPDGIMIEAAEVARLLEGRGIVHGVRHDAVAAAIEQARRDQTPVHDVVIASGTPPRPGEDARIEFLFRREPLAGWSELEDAPIDYRERAFFQGVRRGALLARKTPATPGEPGRDVYCNDIPQVAGCDIAIETVGDAALSEDGLECRAASDGVVVSVGANTVGVFQQYTISSDVDYHTGNLDMRGVLFINGWVRSGFKVHTTGDLVIDGGIEVSRVATDANLIIKGGILGGEQGSVSSRGAVSAQFIENARVWAGGDVTVRHGILNSQVTSDGGVKATEGNGRIIGGTTRAARGVEVNELGSGVGLRTVVDVGLDAATRGMLSQMERECALYDRNRHKIARSLAALIEREKTGTLTPAQKQALAKLTHYRRDIELKRRSIASYWRRLIETSASVKVRRLVHDGVVVFILGRRLVMREETNGPGEFVLDVQEDRVVYRS